jgi:hypothetical protein
MKKANKPNKTNHLYYISTNPQMEEETIKNLNLPFIDKIKATKNTKNEETYFMNIYLNNKPNETDFIKVCDKLNKVLNTKYKFFYSDENNKYQYIHKDITENIINSFNLFINDD